MMGGDVTVVSEPGKGSVFTVRLPAGADTGRAAGQTVRSPRANRAASNRVRRRVRCRSIPQNRSAMPP